MKRNLFRTAAHASLGLAMMTAPLGTSARTLAPTSPPAFVAADEVFINGIVIPMTGPTVRAQALAVRAGRIIAVGDDGAIGKLADRHTKVVDLAGRTLLPGFIDAHGHITMLAQAFNFVQLAPPPVGVVTDITSLQAALREKRDGTGWLIAQGYDDAQLAERRHPTRQELDAVSTDRPIVVTHISGHVAVLNTRALDMLGMLHPAGDPPGGHIRLEADGKTAAGLIEERAMFAVFGKLPVPTMETEIAHLVAAQAVYAHYGITTAQDGATLPDRWHVLAEAASRGALTLDIHALPLISVTWPGIEDLPWGQPYRNHLRVAGVKIIADGSPQARTAWLSKPFFIVPPGHDEAYAGYRQMSDADFQALLTRAADHGWQVYVHVNGDAAIQQLIDCVRAVDARRDHPMVRTIAIHAQTARTDQLHAMKALDIEPTFFASHTFYWGDWHREVVLGPERADRISPQREAFDIGLHPSIHNDAPIVPPDIIRLIWSAATRRTRSGDILGPAERVTNYEALEEVTANAAYELHEERDKGTLEPGKLADLVILDANPLAMDREKLLDLKVLGTVKAGAFIFGS
jgi:predicted amidohydrolase YtcJ